MRLSLACEKPYARFEDRIPKSFRLAYTQRPCVRCANSHVSFFSASLSLSASLLYVPPYARFALAQVCTYAREEKAFNTRNAEGEREGGGE